MLLNLGFFVRDVFTNPRIVLFNFHLFRMETLIFGGSVIVPGTCRGHEPNFLSHQLSPKFFVPAHEDF